jgi:hypothetical protein
LATARETLYDEIVALTASPAGDGAEEEVRSIMARYRVQTKPGTNIPDGITARDALGDRLLDLWRSPPADANAKIGETIDEFRMQVKRKSSGGGKKKAASPKAPAKPKAAPKAAAPKEAEPAAADADGDGEVPLVPPGPRGVQPVAGGPRKRGKTRGECPKCHSMGVVLAPSYAGDEYYSCIYCGWQAYRPADENDPTASLAVRLLGQSGGEK